MKEEIYIHTKYDYLEDLIVKIPDNFSNIGTSIHCARNEVRVLTTNNQKITIKYFRKITIANRLIFATFRKSKAQRSFEHSKVLISKGIATPEPVAYINCYKYGLLYKSYYISVFSNYKPLSELLEQPIKESEEALRAFARFTYKLHNSDVVHNDYTVKNILYLYENNEYKFSLIDNNRMRFRKYSYSRKIKDLERLKVPVDKLGIIAAEYAKQSNVSDLRTLNAMVLYRIRYIFGRHIRSRLKSMVCFLS